MNPEQQQHLLWKRGAPLNAGARESAQGPTLRRAKTTLAALPPSFPAPPAALLSPAKTPPAASSASASEEWPVLSVRVPRQPFPVPASGAAAADANKNNNKKKANPSPAPSDANRQSKPAPPRHRPSDTLQMDLLSLALKSQRERVARKAQKKGGAPAASSIAAPSKPLLRGKQRAGPPKPKKKSSLKRAILRQRNAVWWLQNADVKPTVLKNHPSLLGFDCVWLSPAKDEQLEDPALSGPEAEGLDDELDEGSDEARHDGTTSSSRPSSDSHDASGLEEQAALAEAAGGAEDAASPALNPQSSQGCCQFDASLCSPVFFGAAFKRHDADAAAAAATAQASATAAPRISSTRPVRDYVDQALSSELDALVVQSLQALFKFQERARLEDPAKAREDGGRTKRRLVFGLREVLHGVKARRCILVVVSPNIENAEALDERVGEIIARCRGADHVKPVPVVFAGNRRSLGRALGKSVSVSAVGVFSADGAHETLKPALALAAKLRDVWAAAVRAELAQRRPFLCRACAKPVTAFVRVDCLRCAATACETCQAKQLTCPASGEPCSLVRIARLPPVFRLSAAAPEFVPKAL